MKATVVLTMLFVGLMTMGFDCVNDNALFAVNIQGISGTYKINPGGNPNFDESKTIRVSEYLDQDFSSFKAVRVYDIRITTIGAYAGNVNGTVQVNGVTILTYNGPWSGFSTPQSLITSSLITRNTSGITALVQAILNKQDITLRGFGSVSSTPVPDGLSVNVEVFSQVDAEL